MKGKEHRAEMMKQQTILPPILFKSERSPQKKRKATQQSQIMGKWVQY